MTNETEAYICQCSATSHPKEKCTKKCCDGNLCTYGCGTCFCGCHNNETKPKQPKRFRVFCYTEVGGYIELEAGSKLEAEATAIKMLEDCGDVAFSEVTSREAGRHSDTEEI